MTNDALLLTHWLWQITGSRPHAVCRPIAKLLSVIWSIMKRPQLTWPCWGTSSNDSSHPESNPQQ